jgi:hypothetical protein
VFGEPPAIVLVNAPCLDAFRGHRVLTVDLGLFSLGDRYLLRCDRFHGRGSRVVVCNACGGDAVQCAILLMSRKATGERTRPDQIPRMLSSSQAARVREREHIDAESRLVPRSNPKSSIRPAGPRHGIWGPMATYPVVASACPHYPFLLINKCDVLETRRYVGIVWTPDFFSDLQLMLRRNQPERDASGFSREPRPRQSFSPLGV